METPSQTVSSLLHLVTQWISTVTVSLGSAWNSSQVQRRDGCAAPLMAKSHCASGVRGVGPAERTGKSGVRYCPGGTRPATAGSSRRRPRNPREMKFPAMLLLQPRVQGCDSARRVVNMFTGILPCFQDPRKHLVVNRLSE